MDNSSNPSPEEIRQRMAEIRSATHGDVETILTGLRQNLDWRYHLERHPWGFAGAAALLGYLLVPKSKVKAKFDQATIKEIAAELNMPQQIPDDKKTFVQKWVIPMALKWGTTGALQIGQLLLAKVMAKQGAKEAVQEEEPAFVPPHRPR
jgi:hypothetical protein